MTKKFTLALIAAVLLSWTVYTRAFASQETLRFFENYYFDAGLHFLGGFWLVGMLSWVFGLKIPARLGILLAAVFLWEFFELIAFPDVWHLYTRLFPYWLRDTSADIVMGVVGGIVAAGLELSTRPLSLKSQKIN